MSTIITPQTRTVTLYQGDDLARLEELKQAAEDLRPAKVALAADEAAYAAAIEAHNAAVTEAEERAVKVVLRSLGRKRWRELVAAHPAREGNAADAEFGINDETFGDALVPASIASPIFGSDAELEVFLDSLAPIQFDILYASAFSLNRAPGASPKALPSFERSQSSSAT